MIRLLPLLLLAGCTLPVPPQYGLHKVEYVKTGADGTECRFTMEGGQEFRGVTGQLTPCGDSFELGIDNLKAFEGQQIGGALYSQHLDAEAARRARYLELGRQYGPGAMCAAAAVANFALGALCAGAAAQPEPSAYPRRIEPFGAQPALVPIADGMAWKGSLKPAPKPERPQLRWQEVPTPSSGVMIQYEASEV
jgi:hypothetical protein